MQSTELIRLELKGELYGNYPSIRAAQSAIQLHYRKDPNPGVFQGFSPSGHLLMEHTGLAYRRYTCAPSLAIPTCPKPILVKAQVCHVPN